MINHHPDPPNSQPDEISIGRRSLILPRDASPRADPVRIPLYLDPGKAFGDGRHPTTRLAIRGIETVLRQRCTGRNFSRAGVLDVGCGSGVLVITAMCLGAAFGLGIDFDENALAKWNCAEQFAPMSVAAANHDASMPMPAQSAVADARVRMPAALFLELSCS